MFAQKMQQFELGSRQPTGSTVEVPPVFVGGHCLPDETNLLQLRRGPKRAEGRGRTAVKRVVTRADCCRQGMMRFHYMSVKWCANR